MIIVHHIYRNWILNRSYFLSVILEKSLKIKKEFFFEERNLRMVGMGWMKKGCIRQANSHLYDIDVQ